MCPFIRVPLVKDDGGLDGALVLDSLKSLAELLKLEGLVDNTLGLDLARVEVCNGSGLDNVSDKFFYHSG